MLWVTAWLKHATAPVAQRLENITQSNKSTEITFYPVVPETISYFTGLQEIIGDVDETASEGKKIFFGDIILIESEEDGNGTWLVCSDYSIFCLNFEHLSSSQVVDNLDSAKIIGSRWDNSELLSKTASNLTFCQT